MAKKTTDLTIAESQMLQSQMQRREARLVDYYEGRVKPLPFAKTRTSNWRSPNTAHLGERSPSSMDMTWAPVSARMLVGEDAEDAAKVMDPKAGKAKLKRTADYVGTYNNVNGLMKPEYDVLEPFTIYDTEVYVKQAINRKLALMFRSGWEITTDLDQDMDQGKKNIDYINRRLNTLEYVTNETTGSFFKKILFNLLLCSNCFLRRIRDDETSAGIKTENNNNKTPVSHYQLIPAHSIYPYLEKGIMTKWRRFFDTGMPWVDYSLEEIIHLKWDVKPGHIYGTPRLVGVRDDIFALRRLEENIELLFINHLFPLFHIKVGTEKAPCTYGPGGESEIDIIKYQIETMPKEGVLTTDERVAIEVVGAQNKTLDTQNLLEHLKARVFTGMGVSGIDMGEGADATRATADNISQNLKDFVKADMEIFAGLVRMYLFKEWFLEANYSVSIQKAVSTTKLVFHEIDLDSQIKEQSHTLNLYNGHLLSEPEARKALKRPAMTKPDKKLTHYSEHIKDLVVTTANAKADAEIKAQKELLPLEAAHQEKMTGHKLNEMEGQKSLERVKMNTHVAKAQATTKLTHAKAKLAAVQGPALIAAAKKATPSSKTTRSKTQPSNQHKVNPGPTRAKSSREEFISLLRDELLATHEKMTSDGTLAAWEPESAEVIDRVIVDFEAQHPENPDSPENCYTKQIRSEISRLKAMVSQTTDPDMLATLIDVGCDEDENDGEMEPDSTD